jgi:hypothetical protein
MEHVSYDVKSVTVQAWLSEPEYQAQRERYFGVELACGHRPADPTLIYSSGYPVTTGYGTDRETGEKFCHECCAARDLKRMAETGKGHAYLTVRKSLIGDVYAVTTWPGIQLGGKVIILNEWRDNFGGTRVAFRLMLNGEVWSGSGPGAGMYCRLKRTKLASLYA